MEKLPALILSVTGTRQPAGASDHIAIKADWFWLVYSTDACFMPLLQTFACLQGSDHWKRFYRYCLLLFWSVSSPAAGSGVSDLFFCQASLGHSCDEKVLFLAHTGTTTWQHPTHNQGCSARLSVCSPVHHLCKLDLMNVGELRWKTAPSCWCPLWLGLFIAFILDRWRFNPLDCL